MNTPKSHHDTSLPSMPLELEPSDVILVFDEQDEASKASAENTSLPSKGSSSSSLMELLLMLGIMMAVLMAAFILWSTIKTRDAASHITKSMGAWVEDAGQFHAPSGFELTKQGDRLTFVPLTIQAKEDTAALSHLLEGRLNTRGARRDTETQQSLLQAHPCIDKVLATVEKIDVVVRPACPLDQKR